jgi:glycosyltransferase involved in cell wall biosynthesis
MTTTTLPACECDLGADCPTIGTGLACPVMQHRRYAELFRQDPALWGPKIVETAKVLAGRDVTPFVPDRRRGASPRPTPRPRLSKLLHVRGYLDSWTGYGQIAERVGFGLRDAAGVELSWGAIKLDQKYFPTHPDILANIRDAPPPGANVLQIATPLTQPVEGFPTAVLSMWECDRINMQAAAQLNRAAVVVVPCRHNERAFRDSGVTVPIRVVPMGLDTSIYKDEGDYPMTGRFKFGAAGRMGHGGTRKGLAFAAECFAKVAHRMPEAELYLKIWPDCHISVPDHPRIFLDRSLLNPLALCYWLARLNCYLNPSKGEGWGMIGHQAMAVGRPMIASPASATVDFWSAPEYGWSVDFDVEKAGEFYVDGSNSNWAAPREDAFIAAMLEAYNDREECRRRGKAAAEYAAEFPWSRTACGVKTVLTEFGFLEKPRVALGTPHAAPGRR